MKAVLAGVAALVLLTSCQGSDRAFEQSMLREQVENPTGRYQVAGTREYNNGTEIYCLDTKTGKVGAAFVPTTDANLSNPDCS